MKQGDDPVAGYDLNGDLIGPYLHDRTFNGSTLVNEEFINCVFYNEWISGIMG